MRARLSFTTIALLLGAAISYSPTASAQSSQQDSVAEAARRAREQKKAAARPAPVITDDTFKSAPAKPEVQTPSADAPATSTAPADSEQTQSAAANKTPDAAREAARKKAELAALKQQVEDKQKEVDIAKREFGLESETYYSKPDFSHDREGKARLDAMQTALKQQQDELATLKAKLAATAPEDTDTSKTEAPKP